MSEATEATEPTLGEVVLLVDRIGDIAFSRLDNVEATLATLQLQGATANPAAGEDLTMWGASATEEQWVDLYEWVDLIVDTYVIPTRLLPACWPSHPGAVEELAALKSGWTQARIAINRGPSDQLSYWHDRCLYPLLERLKTPIYGLNECSQSHREPKNDTRRTNRDVRSEMRDGP